MVGFKDLKVLISQSSDSFEKLTVFLCMPCGTHLYSTCLLSYRGIIFYINFLSQPQLVLKSWIPISSAISSAFKWYISLDTL